MTPMRLAQQTQRVGITSFLWNDSLMFTLYQDGVTALPHLPLKSGFSLLLLGEKLPPSTLGNS